MITKTELKQASTSTLIYLLGNAAVKDDTLSRNDVYAIEGELINRLQRLKQDKIDSIRVEGY